jgi:hypothetical protein
MWKGFYAAVILVAGVGRAQQWEVGVVGGYGFTPSLTVKAPSGSAGTGFNNGAAYGAFFGDDSHEHWSGEARYLYRYSDLNLSSGSTSVDFAGHTQFVTADVLGHLARRSSRIRPFFAVGGGLKIINGTGAESAAQPLGNIAALTHTMEFHPVGDVGAGVKLALSRNVRLRLEVRDYISPSPSKVITPVPGATMGAWMNDIQAMVSLSYAFGNER